MTYLPSSIQELIGKCRWFIQSRRTLILATGIALVLTLGTIKLRKRPEVDLHARFGGPNRFLPLGLFSRSRERFHRALGMFADTYGGVYCIKITTKDVVVVSDPELIRQVLTERPNTYIRRFNKINVLPFSGMFTTEGSALGRSSQEVQQALRDTIVGSGHAFMLSIFPWMTRDRFPWNLNPFIKKLHLGIKRLNELCDEIASGRQAERQAGVQASRRDLLDKLLHLDQEDLRGNIITFFIAGSDTSAMSVAWCLYYLCLNPCIQNQARAEVDALGRDPETMKDVDELPLVGCCVLEALRFLPVLGFLPKSLDHMHRALEIFADTYGSIYCVKHCESKCRHTRTEYQETLLKRVLERDLCRVTRVTGMDVVVLSDPDLIRQVLKERPNNFTRFGNEDKIMPFSGMFTAEGEEWKRNRRLGAPAFNEKNSTAMIPDMSRVALKLVSLSVIGLEWFNKRSTIQWQGQLHTGLKRLRGNCDEIIRERLEERRAGVRDKRRDLLDKLLDLDREDLLGNLITFFIAGSDTSAMTVAWCLYYLCLNPCIQSEARAEVDALGHDPETMEDLNLVPYIECCVLEALRLQPPSAFLLHECIADTSLNGKTVPPGTVVITLIRKAMVTTSQGGTIFKPERWLSRDGSAVDRTRAREHLAFGGGPRQCPGQNMAIIEATIVVALILRHFDGLRLRNTPENVRGEIKLTYGPKNLELVMSQRDS
ncbi:hypothetical protein FOZ61_000960 [Perkinsus olseni]|uniref:Cytochrome P450 n=2 Tax=Perkinsus olseni TaxID=32597 RepID=A0A7J6LYE3_PEROL|nr:hypothetical protein FOZ61_000960 [Perkinsus olseni]KAF4670430.1 hypothetical protein FOL46_000859 [Perkinsus olseni]